MTIQTAGPSAPIVIDGVDLRSTTDTRSGADKIGMTTVSGLSGNTVQSVIEALRTASLTNPMSASGDIIYGGTAGVPTRLVKGTDGQVNTLVAGIPAWATPTGGVSSISTLTKTANYTVVAADKGKAFLCSGSFTLSLTAATTLGDGFWCLVSNTGAGTVTIDPDGSETIDTGVSLNVTTLATVEIICNGSNWFSFFRGSLVATPPSATKGYTSGGTTDTAYSAIISKITFATDGSSDAGSVLAVARSYVAGFNSTTIGYTVGGYTGAYSAIISKLTFATDGSSDTGSVLAVARYYGAGFEG